MKKITLLVAFLLFVATGGYAQSSLYDFAQSTGTYTPITGGTVLTTTTDYAATLDSYVSTQQTLPTPFEFAGTTYSNYYVTSNGLLALGTTAPSGTTYTVLSSSTGGNVFIAPFSGDIAAAAAGVSEIRVEQVGNEIVFQWGNWRRWVQAESFSFQVRLNTTTKTIKFVYSGTPPYSTSTLYQPQVGIKNATGDYKALTVASGGSWNTPTVITTGITSTSLATFTGATGFTTGLTYTFTPPAPCSGTPVAGTASGDATRYVCSGTTPAAIAVTGATGLYPGISYQWEQSTNNGTSWANATGGTGATTVSYTPPSFAGTTIQYRLKVTCSNSALFATTAPVTITTPVAPLTQASAFAANSVAPTAFGLSWTAGSGSRRYVVISTSPIVDPVSGNFAAFTANAVYSGSGQQIVYDGTGTSVNVTGLTCNTTYYTKVYEYSRCGSGPYDVYFNTTTGTNAATVSTATPTITTFPVTTAFTGFTGANLGAVLPGWYEANVTTAALSTPSSSNPVSNTSAWVNSTGLGITTAKVNLYTNTVNAWIITPKMTLAANSRLKFKAAITGYNVATAHANRMQGTDDKVLVLVSTDGCGATWTPIYTFQASNTTSLTNVLTDYTMLLTAYTGQTIQIAFQGIDGPTDDTPDYDFHIGNVVIEQIPDCDKPVLNATANITKNAATVSWQAPAIGAPTGYQYVVSTTATAPTGAGTGTTATSVSLTQLLPSTTYYIYVRSACGEDFSDWSVVGSFTTMCDYPDITATTPGSVCGQGSVALGATSTGTVRWYAAQTGGSSLATGATFNTPQITATTTYWAESSVEGTQLSGGKNAPAATSTGSTFTDWGVIFNLTSLSRINAVSVYSSAAGTLDIKIVNAAGTELYATGNVNITNGGTTTPNIIPLNALLPAGTGYKMLVKASSGVSLIRDNGSLTFPYASTDGGLSVTASEWGGSTTSNYYYFYDIKYTPSCASPRQAVIATVTAAPAITATTTNGTICSGASTGLSVTSANASYSYVWMPGNLTGATQTVTPTATTTYTVTATDTTSGCVTQGTVTVVVNALPPAITVPSALTVCEAGTQQLTATSNLAVSNVVGTGTNLPAATSYPNPFSAYYGGVKTQILFKAEELTAQGLVSGTSVTSLSFDFGASAANACNNLRIKVGATTVANLTSGFVDSSTLTTVYNATYTPVANTTGLVPFTLSTPFVWNGGDIIVEIAHNAGNGGNGSGTRNRTTATTYNSVYYAAVDSETPATVAALDALAQASYDTFGASMARPNVAFNYTVVNPITWSPATALYTDANATVPYTTGAAASTVYVKPTAATTYTATATNAAGCSITATVNVTINVVAAPDAPAAQTICNAGTVANLQSTGTAVKWYSAATGGTALATTAALATGNYYASQTLNGCESVARTQVAVTVNVTPAPTASAQTFCNVATVADLDADGTAVQWYAAATGGTALAETAALSTGTYYVSQTLNACESATRTAVAITVNVTPAPTAANQAFCDAATVADLDADGTAVQWYAAATGGTALAATTALANGTYYASQTLNACESATRTAVVVTINITPAPAASAQTFCNAATVADLDADGTAVLWYADATGGTALAESAALATGTYYVSQTLNNCESATRTAVAIVVNVTPAPVAADQSFCNAATVAELMSTGTDVQWYTEATGGTPLAATDALATGTYYASQTENACDSATRTAINVTVNVVAAPTGAATQQITITAGETATIEDIAVTAEGTVTWYASEANALEGVAPLAAGTVLVSGTTYYAVQTVGNCTSTTVLAVTVDVVLGKEDFDIRAFAYYPNPVKDVVTVSYNKEITQISIVTLHGQEVVRVTPNALTATVDMTGKAEGTYLLTVTSGNVSKTVKIVKSH